GGDTPRDDTVVQNREVSEPRSRRRRPMNFRNSARALLVAGLVLTLAGSLAAQTPYGAPAAKLKDFDAWTGRTLKDWNVPAIGVAIVVGDKLVFARGYGYR